jgi:hypothetical protein
LVSRSQKATTEEIKEFPNARRVPSAFRNALIWVLVPFRKSFLVALGAFSKKSADISVRYHDDGSKKLNA